MNDKLTFNNGVSPMAALVGGPTQEEIRHMPQLYRADWHFATMVGGPWLGKFLNLVGPELDGTKLISIDVKVHMLKKGWSPSIPGWHLDDFWRPTKEQPAIAELADHPCRHFMLIFGDASRTQYLEGPVELPLPPDPLPPGEKVYGWYNTLIDSMNLPHWEVQPGMIYRFNSFDFHRGVWADKDGWRAFIRLTESDHREPKNEIRFQSQVYLREPYAGW